MILAGDFRNGVTFEYDNNIFQVRVPTRKAW